MVESNLSYEECRRQRLEENKKRMQELNLNNLANALKLSSSPKSTPTKQLKRPRQPLDVSLLSVRRSSRCADKPPPSYKEFPIEPLPGIRRTYQRRDLLNRVYASHEERVYAIDRARDLQSSLESRYPSFVKPMLQSHVTGGFWLGLPNHFCKQHLPHEDEMITLVDEDENEFQAKYLADKTGLSGGWRGFSIDHQLVDGDAVVFHLIKPTEFKVYIIRAYNLEDRDNTNDDSDDNQLEKSSKRNRSSGHKVRANNSADKADKGKSSDVSPLEKGGKRTTRSSGHKINANNPADKADEVESSDVYPLEKSGKKTTRLSGNKANAKTSADKGKSSDVSPLEKGGKRTTRSSGHKINANNPADKDDEVESSDVSLLEKSDKKTTRLSRHKANAKNSADKADKDESFDASLLKKSGKRTTRSASKGKK